MIKIEKDELTWDDSEQEEWEKLIRNPEMEIPQVLDDKSRAALDAATGPRLLPGEQHVGNG